MKLSVKEPLRIISVDNHILVVDKPPNVPTQPRPSGGRSLEGDAKAWIKKKYRKVGGVFLAAVHRLDLPVSGLVLFARTSKALSRLQRQMRSREIHKTYYARVEGRMTRAKGSLLHFLSHGNRCARVVSRTEGKEALLSYCTIKKWRESSLLMVRLHTGRYHQIRAQLSYIGHPICGDVKYGALLSSTSGGIDLHHGVLEFSHPITQKKITVKSPAPFL